MTIYRRGKSLVIDFYYNGKRYTESCRGVSLTLAKEREIAMRAEIFQGTYKPKKMKTATFKDFSKVFLKQSTNVRDESSLNRLGEFFKAKKLTEISTIQVEQYKKKRLADNIAPATINRELACLKHLFTVAIKAGKAKTRPEIRQYSETPRDRVPAKDELKAIFKAIRESKKAAHIEPILVTAINTGLRKGNLLKLRWADIDLANEQLRVIQTKAKKPVTVPLNSIMIKLFKRLRRKAPEDAVYVFSADGQKPYTDIKTGWWNALEKAGVEDLRVHDLRHLFGTNLAEAGTAQKAVQEMMGHTDPRMTARYINPSMQYKKEAVERLVKK